jgi:hypothetical protein
MPPKWAARERDFMISVGFNRVSKKRPCRICGKPTYCGFSRDEGTSICMRISAGSRGLSRNGGNIHVHPEIPFLTIRSRIKIRNSQLITPAPLEIRDAVFRINPAVCRQLARLARVNLAANQTARSAAASRRLV